MVTQYSWVDVLFLLFMSGTAVYLATIAPYAAVWCGVCAGNQLQVILSAHTWRLYKSYREDLPDSAAEYPDEQLGIKPK